MVPTKIRNSDYKLAKNIFVKKILLKTGGEASQAPLYLGQFDTILLPIINMLVIFIS